MSLISLANNGFLLVYILARLIILPYTAFYRDRTHYAFRNISLTSVVYLCLSVYPFILCLRIKVSKRVGKDNRTPKSIFIYMKDKYTRTRCNGSKSLLMLGIVYAIPILSSACD